MTSLWLVSIKSSPLSGKKWRAEWSDGTHTDFGAEGYSDYTLGATTRQRQNYRLRHSGDHLADPQSAGALSYHILWGESRDMNKNVATFRQRFGV